MKKLFSLSVAALLSAAAFAQDTIPNRQNANPSNKDTIPGTNRNWNDTSNKSRTMDSTYQRRNYPDSLRNDTSSLNTSTTTTDSLSTANSTQSANLNRSDSMSTASSTQTNTTGNNTTATTTTTTTTVDSATVLTDRVIMRDDAMFIILDGQTNSLTETYKLESGATVTSDGTVTYPSGKTVKLKNGQFIEITKSTPKEKESDEMTKAEKKTKTEKSTKTTKKTTKKTNPGTE